MSIKELTDYIESLIIFDKVERFEHNNTAIFTWYTDSGTDRILVIKDKYLLVYDDESDDSETHYRNSISEPTKEIVDSLISIFFIRK